MTGLEIMWLRLRRKRLTARLIAITVRIAAASGPLRGQLECDHSDVASALHRVNDRLAALGAL